MQLTSADAQAEDEGQLAANSSHAQATHTYTMELMRKRQEAMKEEVSQMQALILGLGSQNRAKPRRLLPVVDPRHAAWMPWWDFVTAASLIFTALVTPYEVVFLPRSPLWIFVTNRAVDVVFIFDICLQFRLAYPKAADASAGTGSQWVVTPNDIARHYLRGWFTIDAVSTLTSAFDIWSYIQKPSADEAATLARFRLLRVLRVLRLAKLLRLLRGIRLFRQWELKLAIDYGVVAVVRSLVMVVLCCHWFACFWMLQATFEPKIETTWLGDDGYCLPTATVTADAALAKAYRCPSPTGDGQHLCLPPGNLYAASLYFIAMTITSVGYGDISATPYNEVEQNVTTTLMLLGTLTWAYVVGNVVAYIGNMSPSAMAFRLSLNSLNTYAATHGLPYSMRQEIRDYFHRTSHLWTGQETQACLYRMSPKLQADLLLYVNGTWLSRIWWLRDEDPMFLTDLVMKFQPEVYVPDELILYPPALHVIHSGKVIFGGRNLTKGNFWGVDVLVASAHLRNRAHARAITYVEAFFATRDIIVEAAESFEGAAKRVRRAGQLMAFQRCVSLLAKIHRVNEYSYVSQRAESSGSTKKKLRWQKTKQLNGRTAAAVKQISAKASYKSGRRSSQTGMATGVEPHVHDVHVTQLREREAELHRMVTTLVNKDPQTAQVSWVGSFKASEAGGGSGEQASNPIEAAGHRPGSPLSPPTRSRPPSRLQRGGSSRAAIAPDDVAPLPGAEETGAHHPGHSRQRAGGLRQSIGSLSSQLDAVTKTLGTITDAMESLSGRVDAIGSSVAAMHTSTHDLRAPHASSSGDTGDSYYGEHLAA